MKNGYYIVKREHERLSDLIYDLESFEMMYCNYPGVDREELFAKVSEVRNEIVNIQLILLDKMEYMESLDER